MGGRPGVHPGTSCNPVVVWLLLLVPFHSLHFPLQGARRLVIQARGSRSEIPDDASAPQQSWWDAGAAPAPGQLGHILHTQPQYVQWSERESCSFSLLKTSCSHLLFALGCMGILELCRIAVVTTLSCNVTRFEGEISEPLGLKAFPLACHDSASCLGVSAGDTLV